MDSRRFNVPEERSLVAQSQSISIVDREISSKISQLQSKLSSHAAQSDRIERELNRVLRLSKKNQAAVSSSPFNRSRKQPRDQWGEPPPKPLSLQQQRLLQRQRLPDVSPVAASAKARLSTAERKKKAAEGRSAALRRVRYKGMLQGKNLKSTKRDKMKAAQHRARTSNLLYGF